MSAWTVGMTKEIAPFLMSACPPVLGLNEDDVLRLSLDMDAASVYP